MNEQIMKAMGFDKEVEAVKAGKCPFCLNYIDITHGFRDALSRKEYQISGICQTCQDEIFGK